jgi:outer membrane cobalamin receptor
MFTKKPIVNALLISLGTTTFSSLALSQENTKKEKSSALEVIEVKAQKRAQGYMDVPVAVTTVSGEILDAAQATEFQDLVQVSPSVTFNQSGDMRG